MRKWIFGYLLNVIGYFNLGGVGRLPGYILSLIGPFWNFWIFRSALKLRVKTLHFQPNLEQFQIVCGFENLREFPFFLKYYDLHCTFYCSGQTSKLFAAYFLFGKNTIEFQCKNLTRIHFKRL